MLKNIKHAYTMDNGNGNVLGYCLDPNAKNPTAKPITKPFGEPAGFALSPKGEMLLGKQLEGAEYSAFAACQIMANNFKAIPTPENRDIMVRYLRGWLNRMKKNCPSIETDGENAVWLIGCPTGWKSRKAVDEYRKVFEEAGFANPIIVPESNAAMAHFQRTSYAVEKATAAGGAMCLDLGAYSNDGTFIKPGVVRSVGGYVGASIIEKMIVMVNLYEPDRYRKSKDYNSPALYDGIRKRFETDPVFHEFMILQGRWLKELYFNKKRDDMLMGNDLISPVMLDDHPDFKGAYCLNMRINTEMVEDILSKRPIREVLGEKMFAQLSEETRKEIGGNTWRGCLEAFLERVAEQFPEFREKAFGEASDTRAVVLVTGGASQMDFIEQTILDVYPNVHVEIDLTPILSIAMGLADFAPDKLRAMRFDDAFTEILHETEIDAEGKSQSALGVQISKAYDVFATDTIQSMGKYAKDALHEALDGWKSYDYESDKLLEKVNKKFSDHYDAVIFPELTANGHRANKMITAYINDRFETLLKESGIENAKVFANDEMNLDFTGSTIGKTMDKAKERVKSCFNLYESAFSALPNPGYANILFRRPSILESIKSEFDRVSDAFSELIQSGTKGIFYQSDTVIMFLLNLLCETMKELEKKKKTLLGDLIVEESCDEE